MLYTKLIKIWGRKQSTKQKTKWRVNETEGGRKKIQVEHLNWNRVIFEAFEIIRKAITANGGNLRE